MSKALKSFKQTMLIGASVLLVSYISYWLINNTLEDRHNPFAKLSINQQPSFTTNLKIAGLKTRPEACFRVLEESDLEFQRLEDRSTGEGCGYFDSATLFRSTISYGGDITLKCAALVGLAIWEKHDLHAIAEAHLGKKVSRIRHYGTYSCRNINSASEGERSQHASANAIDIAGFKLDDGTEISVLNDWGKDTPAGKFLKQIHKAACGRFSTVLGPEYNAQHKDHFHFDQSSFSVCR